MDIKKESDGGKVLLISFHDGEKEIIEQCLEQARRKLQEKQRGGRNDK